MAKKTTPKKKSKESPPKPKQPLFIGFDWGTNTSCLKARHKADKKDCFSFMDQTVVGYRKPGILANILPGNPQMMFGEAAEKNRLHLELHYPLKDGVVADIEASKHYIKYIYESLNLAEEEEYHTVIGIPANATAESCDYVRQAVSPHFKSILLIPEPFLAALGFRDEDRVGTAGYIDPVLNSLFVDIGAGTTDISLVQGYYPTAKDQISFNTAGDKIDSILADSIAKSFPDTDISPISIRNFKEKYSFVGKSPAPVKVKVMVAGKPRTINISEQMCEACTYLLKDIYKHVVTMITRVDSDSVSELLQNIILTGGGSRIKNIASELQRMLEDDGYESPKVCTVGDNYKQFVAVGALKAALQARDDQWQHLFEQ